MGLFVGIIALAALVTFSVLGFFALREFRAIQNARPQTAYQTPRRPEPAVPIKRRTDTALPIRRLRRSQKGGFVGTLILSGVLVVAGLWEWSNFGFRGEWTTVQGTILDAQFPPTTGDEVRAQIQFRYTVNDKQFTSPWVEQASGTFNPSEFVAQHQPGQRLTIWYHPLLPSYPSLSRVTLWYPVAALVLGGLLMLAGLISLSRALIKL